MNKFHVNVPERSGPSRASVVCNDTVQAQAVVSQVGTALAFTVNGRPLDDRCDGDRDCDGAPDEVDACTNAGGQDFVGKVGLVLSDVGVDTETGND
ncbi:MAG: hypothetical protein ACKOBP_00450, partial [Planctomycetia bacterium]